MRVHITVNFLSQSQNFSSQRWGQQWQGHNYYRLASPSKCQTTLWLPRSGRLLPEVCLLLFFHHCTRVLCYAGINSKGVMMLIKPLIASNLLLVRSVLQMPNFREFILETDASRFGLGVVQHQSKGPIAFFNKQFPTSIRNTSAYIQEMVTMVEIIKKWRTTWAGYTSLCSLITIVSHTSWLNNYTRRISSGISVNYWATISQLSTTRDTTMQSQMPYQGAGKIQTWNSAHPLHTDIRSCWPHFSRRKIWPQLQRPLAISFNRSSPLLTIFDLKGLYTFQRFNPSSNLRRSIFHKGHSTLIGGHSGQKGTITRIHQCFYLKGMVEDIKQWVCECVICQLDKPINTKMQGLLQPLSVPNAIWEDWWWILSLIFQLR